MSRFWPSAPYAEDQPYPHLILSTHVLYRGFQTGAILGPLVGLPVRLFSNKSSQTKAASVPKLPWRQFVVRSAGTGSLVGTGVLGIALWGRMRGKEEIEWADRSWRLMANKGQIEVDDFSLVGTALGVGAAAVRGTGLGWRGVIGGGAVGNVAGIVAYMAWRHGVKGGKFED